MCACVRVCVPCVRVRERVCVPCLCVRARACVRVCVCACVCVPESEYSCSAPLTLPARLLTMGQGAASIGQFLWVR